MAQPSRRPRRRRIGGTPRPTSSVEAFRARSDEDALCMVLSDEIEAECQQMGRPDMSEPGKTGLPDG